MKKKKILRYQGQDRCGCGGKLERIASACLHICTACGQIYREGGQGT